MQITRRLGALVVASALTVTGVSLVASPAQAASDPLPQQQAASWLEDQLTGGLMYNPAFGGFNDYGLSADTGIALAEIGGHSGAVTAIGNAVRDNFYNYVSSGETVYAGGIAKALVLAQVAGTTPATYKNAVNNQLIDTLGTVAPNEGRIQNQNELSWPDNLPTDTANVFGQAFAVRALFGSGAAQRNAALAFLLAQQCADGGFREKLDPKTDGDQSCEAGDTATYGDRIGATATALVNLAGLTAETGVSDAIADGKAFLAAQQNGDGGFGSDGGNANSTGLAAWALGDTSESIEAAQWLRDRQSNDTDTCTGFGAGNVGAVAFTQESLVDGRNDGITEGTVGEWQRATSQALVALGRVPAPAATANLALAGPTGYVQGGKAASYQVTGAVPGSRVCVENLGKGAVGTANGSGVVTVAVPLPNVTSTRVVRVTDANGATTTTSTKVLGSKTLRVAPGAKRIKKGKAVRVTVSGLAAGEAVTLRYRGAVVFRGKATVGGTFVRIVRVGRKVGVAKLAAAGQFPTARKGATSIRVVR